MKRLLPLLVVFALFTLFLAASCKPEDTSAMNSPATFQPEKAGRIVIVSSQSFRDAEGYRRNILVLRDTDTNTEYLAVSGCGVQQMHSEYNPATKTTETREY